VLDPKSRDVLLGRHRLVWDFARVRPEDQYSDVVGDLNTFEEEGLIIITGTAMLAEQVGVTVSGVVTTVDATGFTVYGQVTFRHMAEYFTLDAAMPGLLSTNSRDSNDFGFRMALNEQLQYGGIRFQRGDMSWLWCCSRIANGGLYLRVLFN
jgi:hypothetical protein